MILETVLGAVLQVLFDRLVSRRFLALFRRRRLDETILERLQSTLLAVNAVLADAEEKQITNPSVKGWLNELKDAVYHAEDILDEIATAALRCNVEAELWTNGEPSRETSMPDVLNADLVAKLDNVTSRLERLADQRIVLGLQQGLVGKPAPRLPTTSLVDESRVCGRDGDIEEIMKFLLPGNVGNQRNMLLIAIVGVGGIGKTTLAQLLYNDLRVREHFSLRAWSHVSEEFDVFNITKSIFESVALWHCSFTDLNVLQLRLKEKLKGKKLLLVLDDLWNESFDDWDLLRLPLQAAASGSRIIVTTRSHRVAETMRAALVHPLSPLSHEDCWWVFAKHAFEDEETKVQPKLLQLGQRIVEKCTGLPLAAKTLGGLLNSVAEVHEWERILNSKMWDLPVDRSNILPALRLSYCYLPAHLKQCFAYCSIFPKGYMFEKENLILLWMAEGFLQQREGSEKSMEELGDEYFHELLSRSFFQQKNQSQFIMHDLLNDLSQFAAGEFCFKHENGESQGVSEKARYFSYLRDHYCTPIKFEALHEVKSLRTFLPLSLSDSIRSCCLDKMVFEKLLPTLSCLRVLSLSHYNITAMKPNFFSHLKHVRYLDLSYTAIRELPKSVCSLYNLQTLIMSYCPNLTELPIKMWHLVNLRYLDLTGTKLREMPINFGRLKSLQTLSTFIVSGGSGARISALRDLLDLHGKLSILDLQNVADAADAAGANLKNKKHLKEIVLKWSTTAQDLQKETQVLEFLRPHEDIQKLTIHNYGGVKFPGWLGDPSFSNIASLRLSECQNCTSLPSLGQLSSLKELYVSSMIRLRSVGSEFYFGSSGLHPPFRSLHILSFESMPAWEEWLDVEGDPGKFPSLQHLFVHRCPRLSGLPSCVGSVKSVHIHECGRLAF